MTKLLLAFKESVEPKMSEKANSGSDRDGATHQFTGN